MADLISRTWGTDLYDVPFISSIIAIAFVGIAFNVFVIRIIQSGSKSVQASYYFLQSILVVNILRCVTYGITMMEHLIRRHSTYMAPLSLGQCHALSVMVRANIFFRESFGVLVFCLTNCFIGDRFLCLKMYARIAEIRKTKTYRVLPWILGLVFMILYSDNVNKAKMVYVSVPSKEKTLTINSLNNTLIWENLKMNASYLRNYSNIYLQKSFKNNRPQCNLVFPNTRKYFVREFIYIAVFVISQFALTVVLACMIIKYIKRTKTIRARSISLAGTSAIQGTISRSRWRKQSQVFPVQKSPQSLLKPANNLATITAPLRSINPFIIFKMHYDIKRDNHSRTIRNTLILMTVILVGNLLHLPYFIHLSWYYWKCLQAFSPEVSSNRQPKKCYFYTDYQKWSLLLTLLPYSLYNAVYVLGDKNLRELSVKYTKKCWHKLTFVAQRLFSLKQ